MASLEPSVAASFHRSVPLALRFPFRFSIERHFTRRAHFEIKSKSQPSLIKSLPKAWANLSFFKIMSSPTRLFFKEIRKSISVLHQFQNEESCNIQRIFLFFFKETPSSRFRGSTGFLVSEFFFRSFSFLFHFPTGTLSVRVGFIFRAALDQAARRTVIGRPWTVTGCVSTRKRRRPGRKPIHSVTTSASCHQKERNKKLTSSSHQDFIIRLRFNHLVGTGFFPVPPK